MARTPASRRRRARRNHFPRALRGTARLLPKKRNQREQPIFARAHHRAGHPDDRDGRARARAAESAGHDNEPDEGADMGRGRWDGGREGERYRESPAAGHGAGREYLLARTSSCVRCCDESGDGIAGARDGGYESAGDVPAAVRERGETPKCEIVIDKAGCDLGKCEVDRILCL